MVNEQRIGSGDACQAEFASVSYPSVDERYDRLRRELADLAAEMAVAAERMGHRLDRVAPHYRRSAVNLAQYLALRRHDIRALQDRLAELGLSSLGRAEANVAATVGAVLSHLDLIAGIPSAAPPAVIDEVEGQRLLAQHTEALLGPPSGNRRVRIMVTAPAETATDPELMAAMLAAGMDCLRINCAHDGEAQWLKMIEHLRAAESALGRRCRVMMDLAGPKLRTGPVEPGPPVVRWRPVRDALGRVVRPAHVWLTSAEDPALAPEGAQATLPVAADWLVGLALGDRISVVDARGARRALRVLVHGEQGALLSTSETAYVTDGTRLRHLPSAGGLGRETSLEGLPAIAGAIKLDRGDQLIVTRELEPGRPATEVDGETIPARIGCTLPAVFACAQPGERIWFDDGAIGGRITQVDRDRLVVEIMHARPGGSRLRAEKGINLPDTDLRTPALTEKDRLDLRFVAQHADLVGLSFVRDPQDVHELSELMAGLSERRPGIVLKIETRRAFESLPELILAAMRHPAAGIMIARGDLAVELGYERLAEVQEEILWIAEAAHLPVIWATQVLETLARTGVASRSEITDAAMGERAECVMLNKGPHIVAAITALDDILGRMQTHQRKKRALLRRLKAWSPGD